MADTKTVLVTGASTGIGFATVGLFARRGWNVAATMRAPANAKSFDGPAERIRPFKLDVTVPATIKSAIEDAEKAFGAIDVVVNNAGYGLVGAFEAMTAEQIRRQIDTNVIGVMNVCRAILPLFRERRGGTIINVASMGGRVTFPLYSVYHATKWAVEGFSEALVYETEGFGIRIKIIEPGAIKTDFYERSMDVARMPGLTAYDKLIELVMPRMQKAGTNAPGPELVAESIFAAATDNSSKLRYRPNSAAILTMRRLLPDGAFRAIVKRGLGL